jgi:PAS domain S-box-containing protein
MATKTPRLSPREREIVDLAATGHTDQGIAHKLDISTPTVGTYWNRIRAKIGPYSRTEIVALILMEDSQRTIEELRSRYEALLNEAASQSETTPWRSLVENAPDAIILVSGDGVIRQANEEAERLFGYEHGELNNTPLKMLVPESKRDDHLDHVREYVKSPERKRMADHVGTTAVRKDQSEFLIAADLRGFEHGSEMLVACIVRPVVS